MQAPTAKKPQFLKPVDPAIRASRAESISPNDIGTESTDHSDLSDHESSPSGLAEHRTRARKRAQSKKTARKGPPSQRLFSAVETDKGDSGSDSESYSSGHSDFEFDSLRPVAPSLRGHVKASTPLSRRASSLKEVPPSVCLGWGIVAIVGIVLAVLALLICIAVDLTITIEWVMNMFSPDVSPWRTAVLIIVGGGALLIPVPLTHFLGGTRRHGSAHFHLFQPFEGGATFVILQALGWAAYSISLVLVGVSLYYGFRKITPSFGLITFASVGGLIGQALVLASLKYFDYKSKKLEVICYPHRARGLRLWGDVHLPNFKETLLDIRAFLITSFLFLAPIDVVVIICIPFWVLGSRGFYVWAVLLPFYALTYRGKAHRDGSKNWPALRYSNTLWGSFERYFNGRVLGTPKLDPNTSYLFGFHPHGIYPMTAFWATRCQQWKTKFPGVDVDILAATVVFFAPFLRELALWCGGRDVTEQSISNALSTKRSILLIPGGQREMRESRSEDPKIVVITRHKGFVRLALRHGVPLVPIFSFGETVVMDNVRFPRIQEYFVKHFAFPFPHFPYGRWFLPIPRPCPVAVVIGDPIPVTKIDTPTEEQINALHTQYYQALAELFERNKAACGYGECTLVFKH